MDYKIIGRDLINATTLYLVNKGTLPQQVIDGMISLILSPDGFKIEKCSNAPKLEQFVRFVSESLISMHNTSQYFAKFKQLPDKMKMYLATETQIAEIITQNANERQNYLCDLRTVRYNGRVWNINLRLIEFYNQVVDTEFVDDVKTIDNEFRKIIAPIYRDEGIEEDIDGEENIEDPLFEEPSTLILSQVAREIMKFYLKSDKLDYARCLFEFIE